MPRKKLINIPMLCIGIILPIFIGYYIAAAAFPGCTLFTWYSKFQVVISKPFKSFYFNQYTYAIIGVAIFIYFIMVLLYVSGKRNYMPGKEMGTSTWGNVKKINAKLADLHNDENDPFNIVVYKSRFRLLKRRYR